MSITDEETKRFLLDEIEHLQAENAALLKMNKYLDLMVEGVQAKLAKAREALNTARSHLRDLPRSATADRIDSIIGQALKEIGE